MEHSTTKIIPFPNPDQLFDNTILLFVDLQHEYTALGRAFALQNIEGCLNNCRSLLARARKTKVTIAHFRLLKSDTFFNPATEFSDWIDEFRPRPNEMVFERNQPSIYSNQAFASFLQQVDSPFLILVGLTGEMSCLSTIVDASHRKHKITYVADASASSALGKYSSKSSHQVITEIANRYADITTTDKILARIQNRNAA